MVPLVLGSLGAIIGFFGFLANLYVLLVLVVSKKTRSSSEWILLHLSSCGLAASISNLTTIIPSVYLNRWAAEGIVGCNLLGAATLVLQLLIVWSICALSADRCAAIVSPLRYTQVVTRKKIAAFFISVWVLSIALVLASFAIKPSSLPPEEEVPGTIVTRILHVSSDDDVLLPHESPYISNRQTLSQTEDERGEGYDVELLSDVVNITYVPHHDNDVGENLRLENLSLGAYQYRGVMGVCLPKMSEVSVVGGLWVSGWVILILVGPMISLLLCDLTVLSIARKQRHRIIMALYQITAVTQVTVTGSKGTPLPGLWLNRSVPARSRACRAVWEDMITHAVLHLPLIVILVLESILDNHKSPWALDFVASLSLFAMPSLTAVLYGIRARPLRAAYKSYLRKRLTNSTLQHEIQQRLSPVDGSPRLSNSRLKGFRITLSTGDHRSASPSPNSSPSATPRRLSMTNDLRPPTVHLMSISPSHGDLGRNAFNHQDDGSHGGKRKARSFLNIPTQIDMQEFWSGLRKGPNRSPTIVITHELRMKGSESSLSMSPPQGLAEQRL